MPFPNGQTLTSNAYTPDALLAAFQTLTAQMLGLNPQSNTDAAYAAVRLDWPTGGQPPWGIGENIAFLKANEEESEYSMIRDVKRSANDNASLRSTWTYSRTWRLSWVFYGPAAFDQARTVNDSLFLDWIDDSLNPLRLYLIGSSRPRYAPELFSGQWWKRADLSATFYEFVTATIVDPTIASAEVLVYSEQGLEADVQS